MMVASKTKKSTWSCVSPSPILKPFGNVYISYNHLTGTTNVINTFPAFILELLSNRPFSEDEICTRLALECDQKRSTSFDTSVISTLNKLENEELVLKISE